LRYGSIRYLTMKLLRAAALILMITVVILIPACHDLDKPSVSNTDQASRPQEYGLTPSIVPTPSTPLSSPLPLTDENPALPSAKNVSGLYAVWYTKYPEVLNLPYVIGGQLYVQWATIEPEEGMYDFSSVDKQLADYSKSGIKTTIQVNGDMKPVWLFKRVPYHPDKLSVQVGNSQGTLMYWHPTFIKAYLDMLSTFADHLKTSPYLSSLVAIRQNFDAIGTEQLNVPVAQQPLIQWIVPPGVAQGPQWSQTISADYQNKVMDAYIKDFSDWIFILVRATIADSLASKYRSLFDSGKLGWFQTGSEAEPRSQGESAVLHYVDDCRTGKTIGYAEPMADAWGWHGTQQEKYWASPPQWNYWRLLNDLNAGVSMIAVYGTDLEVAYNGSYSRDSAAARFQQEFKDAFLFAAKYAGYITKPEESPGAWIAFRYSDQNRIQKVMPYNRYTGDYTFLMDRLPDKTTTQTNIGPDEQRYGAWARLLPAGESLRLVLNDSFASSLEGKKSVLHVTYLDSGQSSFTITVGGQIFKTSLTGTGKWLVADFPLVQTRLVKDDNGAHISIRTSEADIYFHMIELTR
jgi:hypothetical protein